MKDNNVNVNNSYSYSSPMSFSFRCNVGLITLGAVCIATCAAAFTGNTASTFVRHQQQHAHAPSRPSATLIKPLLFNKKGPLTLTQLSMADDDDEQQSEADDQNEWKALIAAFQMYKAAYGDLRVPLRFIVPSMPPWPKTAWGMKLGHRVAAIRSTGKYIQSSEERRKFLEDMGFLWRLRTVAQDKSMNGITFQQIYDAVETYKKELKNGADMFNIPITYVVPDSDPWPLTTRGMPLGKKISTMKGKTFLAKNPEVAVKLQELGVELDAVTAVNDSRFQKVYDALKRYGEIYGDLLVPQPFVVPDSTEEWPEDTWGLRLGARVNAIRSQGTFVNANPERKQMLDDIDFVWTPPPTERGRKRGRMKKEESEAEEAQFEEAGAPPAPQDTTISAMDNLFGASFDFGDQGAGSATDSSKWGLDGEQLLLEERKEEDVSKADGEYVEPMNLTESLQAATDRAIEVGILQDMTDDPRRRKGQQFQSIPLYNDDFGEDFVFEDVVEALTFYKKMYGDFSNFTRENTDFIIPAAVSNAFGQEEATAFDTAASARAAAAIAMYEDEGRSSESEDLLADEIKRLQEDVSPYSMETAIATKEDQLSDLQWPEHLAGMQLGYIAKRIKDGSLEVKHLPDRKATLDAIGFEWGDDKYFLQLPFEKAMCAFYAYYMVRGDLFVWDDFVMPDEDPWPTALAGYEIGQAVKRVRELQNFIEAYHPDKEQMLRMIEFVWFPSLAHPLDPTEGGPTMESKICESYGHPNYFELPEMPPTLIEKMFENGPVSENDDPKQWYKRYYDWDYVKDIWYDLGCRDRAFALHRSGYPQLAEEHAAKYGTGFYDDLLIMLDELHDKTKEYGTLDKLSAPMKKEYTAKLQEWREKIAGTCDFSNEEQVDIDERMDDYLADMMNEAEENLDAEAATMEDEPEDSFEDDGEVYEEAVVEDVEYEYVEVEEEVETNGTADTEIEYEYVEEVETVEEVEIDKAGEEGDYEVAAINVEDELGLDS